MMKTGTMVFKIEKINCITVVYMMMMMVLPAGTQGPATAKLITYTTKTFQLQAQFHPGHDIFIWPKANSLDIQHLLPCHNVMFMKVWNINFP